MLYFFEDRVALRVYLIKTRGKIGKVGPEPDFNRQEGTAMAEVMRVFKKNHKNLTHIGA